MVAVTVCVVGMVLVTVVDVGLGGVSCAGCGGMGLGGVSSVECGGGRC